MPPEDLTLGEEQEQRMRSLLVSQGYEQRYGTSDTEIRYNLNISGPCADFVGYHPRLDRWLIAESKGSDLWSAEIQIANTLQALHAREPETRKKIELRIYTNPLQYDRLSQEPHGTGGYYRQGRFIGTKPDGINFQYAEILRRRISIFKEVGDGQA